MSPLPRPPARPTGMPQMRRKSSIRTAALHTQEQFLDRVRAVAEDPTLLLPEVVGEEPAALQKVRRQLEAAKGGSLPFMARFDKGLLGALQTARQVAQLASTPRLLDARIDGNRRFYMQRGRARRLVNLGVQNWEDPKALLLAWGPIAVRHRLHFFAGEETLWCTGADPTPPALWFLDLAARAGVELAPDDDGAACPHADRPRIELRFRDGPRIAACASCSQGAASDAVRNLHGHVLNRCCIPDQPSRPVEVAALLPDGARRSLSDGLVNAYRSGRNSEADLLEVAVKAWREEAAKGGRRYLVGSRDFGSDQEAFLDSLQLADWERAPVRILTADGHVGSDPTPSGVLAAHEDRMAQALDTLLAPGEGQDFLAQHPGREPRSLLRMAWEEGQRRAKVRGLPQVAGLGSLGQWIDGFAREARTAPKAVLLQRVRKEASSHAQPAHLFAFLCALGLEGEAARHLSQEQKAAGRHWAGLAKAILEAEGEGYRQALLSYLRETGAGEGA